MPVGYGKGNRYRWIYRQTGIPGWARGRYSFGPRAAPDMIYPYPDPRVESYWYGPVMDISPEEEMRMMESELDIMERGRDDLSEEIESLRKEIEKMKSGGD